MTTFHVFTSTNLENIRIGVKHRMWAIPIPKNSSMKKQFKTKSKNIQVGARGFFYCSVMKFFTTPFIVSSLPDTEKLVTDVWDGTFMLPFKIDPLGDLSRYVWVREIKENLPSLRDNSKAWHHVIRIRPNLVFLPTELTEADWSYLMDALGRKPNSLE